MKIFLSLASVAILCLVLGCQSSDVPPRASLQVKLWYISTAIELDTAVAHLERGNSGQLPDTEMQQLFDTARYYYKKIEFLVEYYHPLTARSVNGAAIAKADDEDPTIINPPEGFQVVEELIFPEIESGSRDELTRSLALLHSNVRRIRKVAEQIELTDRHIFDAIRLQVLRIMTLGITGFDSPVALHSLTEACASFDGMQQTLDYYSGNYKATISEVTKRIHAAQAFLRNANKFEECDRADYIISYTTPLMESLYAFGKELPGSGATRSTALSPDAVRVFSPEAWNPDFFAPNYSRLTSDAVVHLGKLLFFDPVLSHQTDRACASCHQPEHAFTDGLPRSRMLEGATGTLRNAPTLMFAGMQNAQFYDMHVTYLEDQATAVITNPIEMHGSLEHTVALLHRSPEYKHLFNQAFPNDGDKSITDKNIRVSLAAYVRSLRPMHAPFDRFMRGETPAISAQARHGFTLFTGKAKCATCHFIPFFNGTVPPNYTETEAEILGVPSAPDTSNALIDPDPGKYAFSKATIDLHAFKTPTLRNIALTAPYMHNGVYTSLEKVIDFYNRGGGHGIGIEGIHQTLPPDNLHLSFHDQQDLLAFLHTLTDTSGTTARPRQLPDIPGISKVNRRIGGSY
ncbi:MAG: cytochrome c peroxidase [Candidatus Kapaibacterium sp.]